MDHPSIDSDLSNIPNQEVRDDASENISFSNRERPQRISKHTHPDDSMQSIEALSQRNAYTKFDYQKHRIDQEQMQEMMRLIRDERHAHEKRQAVLEQKVDLLQLQLKEASHREHIQKDLHDQTASVLKEQLKEAQVKLAQLQSESVNQDHPFVKDLLLKQHALQTSAIQQERDKASSVIQDLERELQLQKHQFLDMQRDLQSLRMEHNGCAKAKEQELRRAEQSKLHEISILKQIHDRTIQEHNSIISKVRQEEQLTVQLIQQQHQEEKNQLQDVIRRLEGSLDERNIQVRQLESDREMQRQLCKELEREVCMRQEDAQYLDQQLQALQYELETANESASRQLMEKQQQVDRLTEMHSRLVKKQPAKRNNDYFSTGKMNFTNRSASTSSRILNTSYTQMCRDLELDVDAEQKLQQQLAHYRSQANRLQVQIKDQKLKFTQEIESLQTKLAAERKRRVVLFEDKIEKSTQLLHQIGLKDTTIIKLQQKITKKDLNLDLKGVSKPKRLIKKIVHKDDSPLYVSDNEPVKNVDMPVFRTSQTSRNKLLQQESDVANYATPKEQEHSTSQEELDVRSHSDRNNEYYKKQFSVMRLDLQQDVMLDMQHIIGSENSRQDLQQHKAPDLQNSLISIAQNNRFLGTIHSHSRDHSLNSSENTQSKGPVLTKTLPNRTPKEPKSKPKLAPKFGVTQVKKPLAKQVTPTAKRSVVLPRSVSIHSIK